MPGPIPEDKLLHATTRSQWRAWLKKNYKVESEVWLVYAKKHTGKPRVSYNDAVEEALCFGWIDSTVRSIDQDKYAQRFSVRRARSKYSQANLERLRFLVEKERVAKDVRAALPDLSAVSPSVPPDILKAIKANKKAWSTFQQFSEPYVRIRIAYIDAARTRHDEFEKRLAHFIRMTEQNKLIGFGGIDKHF